MSNDFKKHEWVEFTIFWLFSLEITSISMCSVYEQEQEQEMCQVFVSVRVKVQNGASSTTRADFYHPTVRTLPW